MARPVLDPSVYLVTDPVACRRHGLVETVRAAARGGATLVQVRDKTASDSALADQARALMAVLRPFGVPLLINDRLEVALATGAHGLHVGQDDGDPADARARLGPDAILGLSVPSLDAVPSADPAVIDYAGVGAAYATSTKDKDDPPIGPTGLAAIRDRLSVPVVGIGGITAAGVEAVIRAGADGVAVVSAICAASDPEVATREIRNAVARARAG